MQTTLKALWSKGHKPFLMKSGDLKNCCIKFYQGTLKHQLCFGCSQAQRGLPVGFLLLWYSVLFTVKSLSLLYLLFIP